MDQYNTGQSEKTTLTHNSVARHSFWLFTFHIFFLWGLHQWTRHVITMHTVEVLCMLLACCTPLDKFKLPPSAQTQCSCSEKSQIALKPCGGSSWTPHMLLQCACSAFFSYVCVAVVLGGGDINLCMFLLLFGFFGWSRIYQMCCLFWSIFLFLNSNS